MARKPRVEYPGALYHVIVRGNQRRRIFHDRSDRRRYLERLEDERTRYDFRIHAYVLMSNHVHLLLETGRVALSKIMQGLQFTYTRYYNRKYRKVGHLFQGRYKAILCDRDAYLLELVRYIHLNPARMKKPLNPWGYRWSSHRAYMGEGGTVKVEPRSVLGHFHRSLRPARAGYIKFMEEGMGLGHQGRYYETVDQRFLGDEDFLREAERRVGRDREIEAEPRRVPFEALLRGVAKLHGVEPKDLTEPGRVRRFVPARSMLVFHAREWSRMTAKELGRRLGRDPSMISRMYAEYAAGRDRAAEVRLAKIIERESTSQ